MNLRYGDGKTLSIQLDDSDVVARCGTPAVEPLDDTVAAVAASLIDPIDYPRLTEATVPGDHIAVAIHRSVPRKRLVLAGILQTLAADNLEPGKIDVVLAPGSSEDANLQDAVPEKLRDIVSITVHNPAESDELAYLATTKDGQPVHVNRKLTDADMVITVGCIRPTGATGYSSAHVGIFPAFADAEMRNRFLAPSTGLESRENHLRTREADEVMWLLGARFTVQLVPGAGDELLQVLAGDVDSVVERGRSLCGEVWECEVPHLASTVVATLEGGPDQQTWENVGRAVDAAARIVEDDGAIIVCSELNEPVGPALGQLIGMRDAEEVSREIAKQPSLDAEAATHLLTTLERAHIYLLSNLDESLVEELGFVAVGDPHEVENVCRRRLPCTLLANAQHARPTITDKAVSNS